MLITLISDLDVDQTNGNISTDPIFVDEFSAVGALAICTDASDSSPLTLIIEESIDGVNWRQAPVGSSNSLTAVGSDIVTIAPDANNYPLLFPMQPNMRVLLDVSGMTAAATKTVSLLLYGIKK